MKIGTDLHHLYIWIKIGRWDFVFSPFRWQWYHAQLGWSLGGPFTGFCYRVGPLSVDKAPLPRPEDQP